MISPYLHKGLEDLQFENSYLKNLVVKEVDDPKQPQTTRGCNYTKVLPTPLLNPRIIYISPQVCEFLQIDYTKLAEGSAEYLSGNKLIKTSVPVSHCYVGHQFGVLAGQLGDGRAITLGDVRDENSDLWEIQLKGTGLTPYSRFADGRAVLRSSIREFLCSEHLWSLGIPTTRALSLVGSDSTAQRDPLYTGDILDEQCAVVGRVAPTFFRFGSFEIFINKDPLTGTSGPSAGLEKEMLPQMINYIGQYHFSKLYQECIDGEHNFAMRMFELVCVRTAILAAYWQCFGFCHGVLNTDNMSILGLTIDFGPFAFLEFFDNFFICNHSDKNGRYDYANQPKMCKWNLHKLASALFLPESEGISTIDKTFDKTFSDFYYFLNSKKLGLILSHPDESDKKLIDTLYELFEDFGFDLTLFFRFLSDINSTESNYTPFIERMIKYSLPFTLKSSKIRPEMNESTLRSLKELKELNPLILYSYGLDPELVDNQVKRQEEYKEFSKKYTAEKIYEGEKVRRLSEWLENYKARLEKEKICKINNLDKEKMRNLFEESFMFKYPLSRNAHKNILYELCDKVFDELDLINKNFNDYKKEFMNKLNPKFILRNHVAQRAIEKAEGGDYSELDRVFKILNTPFDEHSEVIFEDEFDTSVLLAYNICVSCSS